ncbi:hypothetical protein HJC23_012878 [Cyclotella cryptica]|uniref:Uncharacterized protein n=1 Tax=Cyclotella cryptica TaxID=29204 RepID=A0ABD3Q2K7_9STRA
MKRRFVSNTSYTKVVIDDPKVIHAHHKQHKLARTTTAHAIGLLVTLVVLSVSTGSILRSLGRPSSPRRRPTAPRPPRKNLTLTNEFVSTFRDLLLRPVLNESDPVPFLLQNGQLLCRAPHKGQLRSLRARSLLEMISRGLSLHYHHSTLFSTEQSHEDMGLPVLLMNGDGMGCNVARHDEELPFPRLSWSIPSPQKHGGGWCHAVGMVSYEMWNAFHVTHDRHWTWDVTFERDERTYPWEEKIRKAVWRGTTTHEQTQFRESEFEDIPRAKLVKAGMNHPDVIDAGFTAFVERFEEDEEELAKKTNVAEFIPFVEQMKYKGVSLFWSCGLVDVLIIHMIATSRGKMSFFSSTEAFIDIDGNNWSARFVMLLCTNSVVIKVCCSFTK